MSDALMASAVRPPYSAEAEQAILGALLMDNRAWDQVGDLLVAEAFHVPEHRAIYSTMVRMLRAGKLADVVTVYEAGGHDLAFLNALAVSVVSLRGVGRHVELVAERHRRRQAMQLAADLYERAAQPDDTAGGIDVVVDEATGALMRLVERRSEQEPQLVSDLLPAWIDRLNDRVEGRDEVFPTGIRKLDELTAGGGRRGELWVLGARPSMGKSAGSLTVALNLSQNVPALALSQEDSTDVYLSRAVANVGRINLAHLRNPRRAQELGEMEAVWSRVAEGVDDLGRRQLLLDDQGGLGLADVRRKVRQAKRKCPGLALVVVDYLQLMQGEEGDNRNQMLGFIANGLLKLAKDEGVWIMLLSQLSRKADERSGVPQMSDLRDSGDIEGAATVILLLHREHRRNPKAPKEWAQIHVAKQKNGPTDTISAQFDGAYQRLLDWEGPEPDMGFGKRAGGAGRVGGLD